eukprot:TRINITY_DN6676_c0_g1_i1.p2 TRINITY_DN6676_c0_g1~~TRINITY_DN6676_c0_g1_i1.p2  ORF type:complete len:123 (-),score=8.92 TRINITY_DN6676_c0_g1_i1:230-598(-)
MNVTFINHYWLYLIWSFGISFGCCRSHRLLTHWGGFVVLVSFAASSAAAATFAAATSSSRVLVGVNVHAVTFTLLFVTPTALNVEYAFTNAASSSSSGFSVCATSPSSLRTVCSSTTLTTSA